MSKDTYPGGYNAKIGRLVFALAPSMTATAKWQAYRPLFTYLTIHTITYIRATVK